MSVQWNHATLAITRIDFHLDPFLSTEDEKGQKLPILEQKTL